VFSAAQRKKVKNVQYDITESSPEETMDQLRTGKMMVVDGVEVDFRGMEWFMENPVGMLGMQDFMQKLLKEFKYDVVQKIVDYCAWGHYYQKPTHVWTSMIFWEPIGT
jgi:hypothetical protein